MFQNMGPSPTGRSGHAMASNGTRVFVLGGESSAGTATEEAALIYVLDTSTCSLFLFLPRLAFQVGLQSTSSIRNPTLMLPNPVMASSPEKPLLASLAKHKHCPRRLPHRLQSHEVLLLCGKPTIPRS